MRAAPKVNPCGAPRPRVDEIERVFDEWSASGRSGLMEAEHSPSVVRFLHAVQFRRPFRFLDIGCGNGWVVRLASGIAGCTKAVGIDKSSGMIREARARSSSRKESFARADIERWSYYGRRFDYAFSMESLYYAESVSAAVSRAHALLADGGQFFCGTDFYAENAATTRWASDMGVRMHLLSRRQWRDVFTGAGFSARTTLVKDPSSRKKWKREMGTLFITGTKAA